MDFTEIPRWAPVAAAIAAAISAFAAWRAAALNARQASRGRETLALQLALELEKDFFRDEYMVARRRDVASAVKRGDKEHPGMRDIIGFLDTVGALLRRGVIDEGLAFHNFGRLAVFYRECCADFISARRAVAPKAWSDFDEELIHRMTGYMRENEHGMPTRGTPLYHRMLDDEASLDGR